MSKEGFTVWLTGLPCSGKSTISKRLATELSGLRNVELLDGDIVRQNLSKGLGFTREDRDINIRRIGFVAKLLTRNGVAVIVAAVSPYEQTRAAVRAEVERFFEVHVDCPLEECERRDVKGMYKKARAGEIKDFTGVDDPYEIPSDPDCVVHTVSEDVDESVARIIAGLEAKGYL